MTERIWAFRRARAGHLRMNHGQSLLGCTNVVCRNRVQRLRAGLRLWTIAPFENEAAEK